MGRNGCGGARGLTELHSLSSKLRLYLVTDNRDEAPHGQTPQEMRARGVSGLLDRSSLSWGHLLRRQGCWGVSGCSTGRSNLHFAPPASRLCQHFPRYLGREGSCRSRSSGSPALQLLRFDATSKYDFTLENYFPLLERKNPY